MAAAPPLDVPVRELQQARIAVSGLFFINAVLFANLVPRYPEVKERLGLSNAALGGALAAFPLGALLAGLFAAVLIRRFGSAAVASRGLVALGVLLALVPLARNWPMLALAMLGAGALDAIVDVAQNAHGFRVQRLYRRSIVNAFHCVWSIGAVLGGLMGSVAAGLDVPLTAHLVASAVLFGSIALACNVFLLPGAEDAERDDSEASSGKGLAGIPRAALLTLLALGIVAACGAFVEDAGASWGALYLRTELGTGAAVGGLAFVALQVAMTAGRLTGDRVVDRFGQRTVALGGGVLIAGGMGAALAVPSVGTTLLGFTLAGLGVATLIPAVMHTAEELPGLPHGVGLTMVSWLLRAGFLLSPPLVGIVADAVSLRVALLSVVVAGLGILTLGRVLRNDT